MRSLTKPFFSQAIPYKQAERDVSLREILQQIPTDDTAWSNRPPLAEASIRHYLGLTCQDASLTTEAQIHFERALALRLTHLGENHIDTARTKFRLAAMQAGPTTTPEQGRLAEEAVDTLTTQLGEKQC